MTEFKLCPKCQVSKPVEEFGKYFSKERQREYVQSLCKLCKHIDVTERRKKYYYKTEAHRKTGRNKQKRNREELNDTYIISILVRKRKLKASDIRAIPGLIEVNRANILLKRTIKKIQNEKQQN
ncbi:MAG TPA: hypothetical protein VFF27_00070 [Bacteroidia bacterium]|jgi:hypothetical protein|nr:hypothetical protein [Bacteroidia bacterium]